MQRGIAFAFGFFGHLLGFFRFSACRRAIRFSAARGVFRSTTFGFSACLDRFGITRSLFTAGTFFSRSAFRFLGFQFGGFRLSFCPFGFGFGALGFQSGFTHMEWYRKADGEVVFGEIGARPPGAHQVDQMNYACDFDVYREWGRAVAFGRFDAHIERKYNVSTIYKRAQGEGRIVQQRAV